MCDDCPLDRTITLTTGEQCCSMCERHRNECEARWLLRMPSKAARRRYLDGDDTRRLSVRKMRGEQAVKELEILAMKLWEKSR